MPEDSKQQNASKPNPSGINWKNVLIGVVIGAIVIGLGVLIWWLLIQPKPTSASPTSTTATKKATSSATPSAQKDETAGWKTYENKEYSFSFKYPANWYELKDVPGVYGVMLSNYNDSLHQCYDESGKAFFKSGCLTFTVQAGEDKETILENAYVSQYQAIKDLKVGDSKTITDEHGNITYKREVDSLVAGYQGLTMYTETKGFGTLGTEGSYNGGYGYNATLTRKSLTYEIDLGSPQKNTLSSNLNIFNKIIATFKFLPSQ